MDSSTSVDHCVECVFTIETFAARAWYFSPITIYQAGSYDRVVSTQDCVICICLQNCVIGSSPHSPD